jgi:hypothetical protein
MAGELERALGSIDLSLNRKESKYRELATLQAFEKERENDQLQEQQSQIEYQKYEESVNEFSQSLLENDRNSIRKVHEEGKTYLREQLKMHGGSYKKFMANGGLRVISNYKNSIINSDESNRYADNSKNMARIIQARDSGKAHLISKKDLYSVNKYQTEGGGEITYSGLLSPVDQVDANAYGLGEDIPTDKILRYKNNYTAILGNYMRENPEKQTPTERELLIYTNQKYRATGKNQAAIYANKRNQAKSSNKSEKQQHLIFTSAQKGVSVLNTNADESVGFKVTDDNYSFYHERGRKHNGKIFSNKQFTDVSETEVNTSWNPSTWFNDVNETRPKEAYEFSAFSGSFGKAAKEIFAQNYNSETNKYNIPSSELVGANGSKLDIDSDDQLSLTPRTVIMAPTAKGLNDLANSKNEEEFMIVEFADKNGKLSAGKNKKYIDNINDKNGDDLNAQYKPWYVFEDSKGKLYYKKMNLDNVSEQKAYTDAIGEQNDFSDEVEAQNTVIRKEQLFDARKEVFDSQNKKQIEAVYNNGDFSNNVYKNIIVNNKLSKQPDIFESLVVASGMTANRYGGNVPMSANGLGSFSEKLMDMIPKTAIGKLRSKNLSFKDAYIAVSKGMKEEAETEEDKQEVDLFLDYWKTNYELKTNKKIKF